MITDDWQPDSGSEVYPVAERGIISLKDDVTPEALKAFAEEFVRLIKFGRRHLMKEE